MLLKAIMALWLNENPIMKKYLVSLLMLLFSTNLWAFSQADLVNLLQKPENSKGEFSQQRYLKALSKPITTSGNFTLVKNKGLLWVTEKPFANQLKVTSKGISQWNGSAWESNSRLGQGEQIKLFLGLLSGDTQALASQFGLTLSGNEKNWQLQLMPSSLLMKQIFSQIIIQGDQLVQRIELHEKQGDRTVILFHNQQINQPLSSFVQSALH